MRGQGTGKADGETAMRQKRQNEKKKIVFSVIGVAALFAMVAAGAVWVERQNSVKAKEAAKKADAADEDEFYDNINYINLYDVDYIYDHDIETYLIIGTDHSGNAEGEGDQYQGSMADFLAMLILDKTKETYAVLQLNRDTITEIPMLYEDNSVGEVREMQLCTAHWYGSSKEVSCENTVEAVSMMLGDLYIEGHYALPMDEIPKLNSVVGGVEVTVEDDFSNVDPSLKTGETVTLTDEQASHFVQGRMGVGDGENTSRMRRQKQYIEAFAIQAKQKSQSDPQLAAKIYQEFDDIATTDISGKQVSKIANRLMNYKDLGVYEFAGVKKEGENLEDGIAHVMFYPDESSVIDVMTKLYSLQKDE